MISEAISKIQQLAATSKGPHALKEFPDQSVFAIPEADGGWKVENIDRQPKTPDFLLSSLDDALTLAAKAADPTKAVWIMGDKGVGVLTDRTDNVSPKMRVVFEQSDAWKYLCEESWKTHRDFIAFIRRSMPFLPSSFTGMVKNLKIEKTEATESEATPTSAAMGKRFNVKASGAGELPDSVSLGFKPFFNVDFGAAMQCVFEIDFDRGMVRLVPLDGETEGNIARMHEQIRGEIATANPAWLIISGSAA